MAKLIKTPLIKNKFIFWYLDNDKYVGQRIALDKYEPYLTDLMLSKIHEGDIVLDIGANIGYDTVLFANKVGKKGKVIAIEPNSKNFEILQKNIKENKLFNVVAVKAALGKENKKMKIYESEDNFGDHRMYSSDSKHKESDNVFCRKLDDLLNELEYKKIDFIKMDVQGFEPLVIEGGQKTIEYNKPTIFFEYWPWGAKSAGSDIEEMNRFFRKIYKKIFWVDEYIQIHFPVSDQFLNKKYNKDNEEKYGNLFVKANIESKDMVAQLKDFWLKKLIKRVLGKDET